MPRILTGLLVAWMVASAAIRAQTQERIGFTARMLADRGAITFAPATVCFDHRGAEIMVLMWEHDGTGYVGTRHFVFRYEGAEAMALMASLNTMNFAPPNL